MSAKNGSGAKLSRPMREAVRMALRQTNPSFLPALNTAWRHVSFHATATRKALVKRGVMETAWYDFGNGLAADGYRLSFDACAAFELNELT